MTSSKIQVGIIGLLRKNSLNPRAIVRTLLCVDPRPLSRARPNPRSLVFEASTSIADPCGGERGQSWQPVRQPIGGVSAFS